MDANDETWTRKRTIPHSRFDNDSAIFEDLPARRYGHAMASGTTFNNTMDNENQERVVITDRIVMFGGRGLYE